MKFAHTVTIGFISLCGTTKVLGWGPSGHQAVGYVAMEFLTPKALSSVKQLLGPTYSYSLGPASTWADEIKALHGAPYAWASELHFVNAEDSLPTSCSVVMERDCSNGRCIITAIANYTDRVLDKSLNDMQHQEALKFLAHFCGDIGQPLHTEHTALGGNKISVKCNGKTVNLHALWDSSLVDKLMSTRYNDSVTTWAHTLASQIKHGKFTESTDDWFLCSSTSGGELLETGLHLDMLQCALIWARESNAYDCSYVFNYANGTDLCDTSYYDNAIPIIEIQVAKQGFRLGKLLNLLFNDESI